MARKKFEEVEYDPFQEEARRNLARQVTSGAGHTPSQPVPSSNLAVSYETNPSPSVVPISRSRAPDISPAASPSSVKGPQKSRTFKCASATQDKELDSFLLRLGEASGTGVPFQVIARAAIAATMRSEENIIELIRRKPPMRRPANVSATEYAQFEQYWVETVVEALRKLRPYQ